MDFTCRYTLLEKSSDSSDGSWPTEAAGADEEVSLEEGDEEVNHEDVLNKEVDGLQQRSQPRSCGTKLPGELLRVVGTH